MSDLEILKRQEDLLVFNAFDEVDAYSVGTALREAALARQAPVVIDIRSAARRLYFAALPGASPDNQHWAQRKGNVVLRKDASSLSVGLTLAQDGRSTWPDAGLDDAEFAAHGGAFPVRVKGCGVVASIAVSGLPSREDHDLVVTTLARHLGVANCPVTPG